MNGIDEEFALLKNVRADLSENRKNSNAKTVKSSVLEIAQAAYDQMFGGSYQRAFLVA